jgi:osmotically-inducible protein OsmY
MIKSQSADVQTMVLNALHWDLAIPSRRLEVEVENGWVTMSGVVDRPYERACAESDARKVPGVVGVINQIRLAPAPAEQGAVGLWGAIAPTA